MQRTLMRNLGALTLVSLLALMGCEDDTTDPKLTGEPARVMITPGEVVIPYLGETAQLSATVMDEDYSIIEGASVEWSSSADSIATVNATGLVTGHGEGIAEIMATSGDVSGRTEVMVVDLKAPAEAVITPAEVLFHTIGETVQLSIVVYDREDVVVPDPQVVWTSSDEDVAVVDEYGLVEAVGLGAASIMGEYRDAMGGALVTVAPKEVLLDPAGPVELNAVDETLQFSATAFDGEGNPFPGMEDVEILWSSTDPQVASVDDDGLVTAFSAGTTTIRADVLGIRVGAMVTVRFPAEQFVYDIEAQTLGEWPEGWEVSWTSRDGDDWEIAESGGRTVIINDPPGSNSNSTLLWIDLGKHWDVDVAVLTRFESGSGTQQGIVLRANHTAGGLYGSNCQFRGNHLRLRSDDGTSWNSAGTADVSVTLGEWYWMRYQAIGSRYRCKIWPEGADEPSAWNLESDGSWTPDDQPGYVGFYAWDGNIAYMYNYVGVGVGGAAPPMP